MRGVRRTRRKIHEERLIGDQRLLLPNPVHGLVCHVLHEVIALFGRFPNLDGCSAFVERWIPLVGLAADESVEVFESTSTGWPCIERAGRTGLPDRDFMTLAELSRRISVELERSREWRAGVRQKRVVSGRRGRYLGDTTHANRVMIPSGKHGLSRRRTECRGMESVVFQATGRQKLCRRRVTWAAEGTGCTKAHIVKQDDQDVGRTFGRTQWRDRWVLGVGILRIVGHKPCARLIRNWKNCSL